MQSVWWQGPGRGFGAQFAPQPGFGRRPGSGEPAGTPELRRRGSKYMEAEEIESILRIQWKSLHNGVPYTDDYYFQVHFEQRYEASVHDLQMCGFSLQSSLCQLHDTAYSADV